MRFSNTETKKLLKVLLVSALFIVTTAQIIQAQPASSGSSTTHRNLSNKKSNFENVAIAQASGTLMNSPGNVGSDLIRLRDALRKYTEIDTIIKRQIRLSSREVMKIPFMYIAFEGRFELTKAESDNLKTYLEGGGFIMLEKFDISREENPSKSAFTSMINKALGSKARVRRLPNSHQIYSSYFDFPDGPPLGGPSEARRFDSISEVNYLEGISMNGRLVGICSSQQKKSTWSEMQLRFGINAIVFALTQKGGIAGR
ncbi:DUF4159 domain-containing protein [Candidatus Latescibacterota bacterium]